MNDKKFSKFYKIINVTDTKKIYLIFLIFLMLISSFADILSLGLIIPYVTQILNLQKNPEDFLPIDLNFLSYFPEENFIFLLTLLLIFVFFLKSLLSILIRWMISKFSFEQFAILQVKLLSVYQNMNYEDHILRSSSYIKNIRELCRECLNNMN